MRLLRVFIAHEAQTQLRSARFYGISIVYLAASVAPAVAAFVLARRATSLIGAPMYAALMDSLQPLATTLFAALIAVDVVSRERDENSLAVASMAPVSSTGYVLRRWLALVALLLPVTLIPRLVAVALLAQAERGVPDAAPIFLGWAVHVVPLLIVVTALAVALGTITSRTVLALIGGLGLFTIGFGIANDLLALAHRQIRGPGEFFGLTDVSLIVWMVRGYASVSTPTAAGYPLARQVELMLLRGATGIGAAALFLGIACSYLRRTKRDLRPWKIRDDHQLRSFIRTTNRFREELAPDGGLEIPERIAAVLGLVIAIGSVTWIVQRQNLYASLGAERYASETTGVEPMPVTIIPVAAGLRGRVTTGGELIATATVTLRNDGDAAQRELAFVLNRGIGIDGVRASRGAARVQRVWERVGVVLDPPLAPRETRDVAFALRGAPGTYDFSLPHANTFAGSWRRYINATKSFDMADLSRSTIWPDANAQRLVLAGPTLFPVPRYSPWQVATHEREWRFQAEVPRNTFTRDIVTPPTAIAIDLDVPDTFLAVDSCGGAARGRATSRCTFALADFILIGAALETSTLAGGVRLASLPAHALLARKHGAALAGAITLADKSWPTFNLHESAIFVERPTYPDETYRGQWSRRAAMRSVATHGALSILPEPMFIVLEPLPPETIAAALITSDLVRRRPVIAREQAFFRDFYETVATWRTGGQRITPVEPTTGPKPLVDPILAGGFDNRGPIRLMRVLGDVEGRIGADRLIEGVEDFVAAGKSPGTAKELLDAIGRRGGVSLDRVYTDYFLGIALPKLTLTDVTFTRAGDGWDVRGKVQNLGTGESFCPVALRDVYGSVRTTVRVDSNASTEFVLHTRHEPRTVQLDPERIVYRHAAVGVVESVDFQAGS